MSKTFLNVTSPNCTSFSLLLLSLINAKQSTARAGGTAGTTATAPSCENVQSFPFLHPPGFLKCQHPFVPALVFFAPALGAAGRAAAAAGVAPALPLPMPFLPLPAPFWPFFTCSNLHLSPSAHLPSVQNFQQQPVGAPTGAATSPGSAFLSLSGLCVSPSFAFFLPEYTARTSDVRISSR